MRRVAVFTYGVVSYVVFLATFAYLAGFLGDFLVPKSVDAAPTSPLAAALLIDAALIALFGLQHSIMARQGFKRRWTRLVHWSTERTTYGLFSSAALWLLFWQWRPIGGVVWDVGGAAGRETLYGVYALGWGILLLSTFLINHFDLFGLRQVYLRLREREYTRLSFGTPLFYRVVRHPIYVGFFLVFWAAPTMTAAHLAFAALMTGYILIAVRLEERDLLEVYGRSYSEYREHVPMFIPRLHRAGHDRAADAVTGGTD